MSSKKKIIIAILFIVVAIKLLDVYLFGFGFSQMGYGRVEYLYNSAKHNYNYENNIVDLQYMKNEELYLHTDAEELRIRDYEADKAVLRATWEEGGISSFAASDSYIFYLNSVARVCQFDVGGNRISEMSVLADDNIKLAYAEDEFVYIIDRDSISVLDVNTGGTCKTIEGFTKYEKNEMGFVRSVKDDNYLLILGSNYDGKTHGGKYINTYGTVGEFNKSVICFVNLESGQVEKEYVISSGEVVYMDEEKYATVKEGVISFYNFDDEQKTREVAIKGYEMPEDENDWYEYSFVCYNGNIRVSNWEGIIDEISVE